MFDQRLQALTSQLTKMTPQQRQQFAMLHKNDPILVSMTKYVNDQENALRNSLKAQQSPQGEKPKVVDQTIAGLAGLPAPELAQMPDGGIAGQPEQGYADGGRVNERHMGVPLTGASMGIETPPVLDINQYLDLPPAERKKAKSKFELEREKNMATVAAQGTPQRPVMPNDPRILGPVPPLEAPAAAAPAAGGAPSEVETTFNAALKETGGGGGGMAMPRVPGAPQYGALDIAGEYNKAEASLPTGAVASKEIDELTKAEVAAANRRKDRLKEDQDSMGVAGLDREKRLKSREEKLDKRESQNAGMAILDAGLAMMAGKSQHAMVNIGEGALQGTKRYREGQKEIDEGRDKLDDAFSRLEELRRGEKRADSKEMRDAMADVDKASNAGLAQIIQGIQKRYEVNAKTASTMLESSVRDVTSRRDAESRAYSAQVGYAGQIGSANIHAGATMGAARLRHKEGLASLALQKQELAQGNAVEKLRNNIERTIAEARKGDFQWTPQKEAAMRQQLLQQAVQLNPSLAKWMGALDTAPAPTGPDMSQFRVVR